MSKITEIRGREVLDSRGYPTVEAQVTLSCGSIGRAIVPSGASTGIYEALELRDGDMQRYNGKGVLKAIGHVNKEIRDALVGHSVFDQAGIDKIMLNLDGTENKTNLGANAMLAVSMACARAGAAARNMPLYKYLGGIHAVKLPMPLMNILNGGVHADNHLDFQEYMIVPFGAETFSESVRMGSEVFHSLQKVLKKKQYLTAVGDEGGFAPDLKSTEEALDTICEAITAAGYEPKKDIKISLDVAASELFKDGKYHFEGKELSADEMVSYYEKLNMKYPIFSIEDGLDQDDWDGWKEMTKRLGNHIFLIGDDLFVTKEQRLRIGIAAGAGNGILVKVNQIGSLTETFQTIETAKQGGYKVIISHRSGETEDTTIADLSVACGAGFIKTGSMSRGERTAKYNRLLRIEEALGSSAAFRYYEGGE